MKLDHFINIYRNQAHEYHRMIEFEDHEQNLFRAMEKVTPIKNKKILDLGSGTGRIPLLIMDLPANLVALDMNWAMLVEQKSQMHRYNKSWDLVYADMRLLPSVGNWADIVTAGWAAGHFCGWYPDNWEEQVDIFIMEMLRSAKSDGILIIFETLGTGSLEPNPPTESLAQYYNRLESKWDFNRVEIQTDYSFGSVEEAIKNTAFFFGDELAKTIKENNWSVLPEWTGMWHRKKNLT